MFQTYVYQPILQTLIVIYERFAFHDLGVAIILLTIVIRVVLLPLFYKGAKDQSLIQRLQPKVEAIQREHRENKEEQGKKLMELYREHQVNPLSSIMFLALQLPIFFALFKIFQTELGAAVFETHSLFGVLDLIAPNTALVALSAGLQYVQAKLSLPKSGTGQAATKASGQARIAKAMLIVGPLITFFVFLKLPSALSLYWLVSTVFSIIQQVFINRSIARTPLPA